jgi:hypothetical protein
MIEGILFLTIYSALPIFWFFMLRLTSIKLLRISIPGILMLMIFVFQYIGFPILFFEWDSYRALKVNNQNIIWMTFIWSSVTITLLITGFIFSRKFFGPIHAKQTYNIYGLSPKPSFFFERLCIIILFIVSFLVFIKYTGIIGFSNLAIIKVISNVLGLESVNLSSAFLRSEMGNNFTGKYHWYRLFMRDLMQIVTVALFSQYLLTRRLYYKLFFLISFFITTFSMVVAIEKAPFLWFFVSLSLAYFIIRKSGYIPTKSLLLGLPMMLALTAIAYIYFMNAESYSIAIRAALSRILVGQIQGLYHYLIIFPEQVDYLLGRSFPNPGGLFPWEPYRLTVEVKNLVNPENIKSGIVGSMPTFFWGEMYANFGYIGIIIPPLFVGIFLYWFNLQLFRLPMSPLSLSFFIWFIMHFKSLSFTGLSKFIINVDGGIIFFILLVALIIIGRGNLKYRRTKHSGRIEC